MLDPTRCFLPDGLVRTVPLVFLTTAESRLLNQLRARRHAALLACDAQLHVLADLSPAITVAAAGALATLRELEERVSASIGVSVVGPVRVIAPDAAQLVVLLAHAGWASQLHAQEHARANGIDPIASAALSAHALYAARQLARIERILDDVLPRDEPAFTRALDGALRFLAARNENAAVCFESDLATHEVLSGRVFSDRERARVLAVQRASLRWNHVCAGLAHPACHALVARRTPRRAKLVAALAAACA